jgi:Zn-dependent metalloprotease
MTAAARPTIFSTTSFGLASIDGRGMRLDSPVHYGTSFENAINSGILNHGYCLAAKAIGGKTWEVLGPVWYGSIHRLKPEADFADFVQATVDIAGELYGNGGHVQRTVYDAWARWSA